MNTMHAEVSFKAVRQIAVDAGCDPRTAERLLRGEPVRGRALVERIRDAMKLHGVSAPIVSRGRGRAR
jgi:hypothetical protein